MKNQYKILLASLLILISSGVATAKDGPNLNLSICNLMVFPFDKLGSLPTGDLHQYVSSLADSTCRTNTAPFPHAHKDISDADLNNYPLPQIALDDAASIPDTEHTHNYYNNSEQDANYIYYSFIDRFEITIQHDAIINTDLNNLKCPIISGQTTQVHNDFENCKDGAFDPDHFGGVKLTNKPGTDAAGQSTRVLTWYYNTNGTNHNWPWTPGINPDVDSINNNLNLATPIFTGDTNLLDTRKFSEYVRLRSNDNSPKKVWTGTTTSRILIIDRAFPRSNIAQYNNFKNKSCADGGWCTLNPLSSTDYTPTVPQSRIVPITKQNVNYNFFWVDIGTVATVWKNNITPPPSDLACADLKWDGPFQKKTGLSTYAADPLLPNNLLADQAAILRVKPTYANGTGQKRPLEYHWVAFQEANRPSWFTNQDLLPNLGNINLLPYFTSSLPGRLIQVAHAAADSNNNIIATPTNNLANTPNAGIIASLVKLGLFRDESSTLNTGINPLTDTDIDIINGTDYDQVWYSGGSTGVKLGVQAFYSDEKIIPGKGDTAVFGTGTDQRTLQKAPLCHLETTIQPPPATCIGLTITPNTVLTNTPVTFTVTPKFSPAGATIPLDYGWSAKSAGLILSPSIINALNPSLLNLLPGTSNNSSNSSTSSYVMTNPSWFGHLMINGLQTSSAVQQLINPTNLCPGGNCFSTTTVTPHLNTTTLNSLGGANVFADFGKAEVLGNQLSPSQNNGSSIPAAAAGITSTLNTIPTSGTDSGTAQEYLFGAFKDSSSSTETATNPYLEKTDNNTYYTGGPSGTLIKVTGQGKDGTLYPACSGSLIIPPSLTPICKQITVTILDGATAIAKEAMVADKPYTVGIDPATSVKTDNSPVARYSFAIFNQNGDPGTLAPAPGNAATCNALIINNLVNPPTISVNATPDCKYLYTAHAGDKITWQADPTNDQPGCLVTQTIPTTPPGTPICQSLNLTLNPLLAGNEIAQGQKVDFTTDPRDTQNNPRNPVVYTETGSGYFIAGTNAATCPAVPANTTATTTFEADSSCKYSYQAATDNTAASVNVKVKADDAIQACSRDLTVKTTPGTETCQALNLQVNGAFTLNPMLSPNTAYSLQASPITTQGNAILYLEWTENGHGVLVGQNTNPAICPSIIDNTSTQTPVFCRYTYAGAVANEDGFSVKAVPDDNNPNCRAQSTAYIPPHSETPYCSYLDLSYSPSPFTGTYANLTAKVVMSDGSTYNDKVRFVSTDGSGQFNGGLSYSGSGTNDYRSNTVNGSTQLVNFNNGSGNTGLNIFLSNTNIGQSAACQRQIAPIPTHTPPCDHQPNIERHGDLQYCAANGDSVQYVWNITGPGNPVFSNGQHSQIGQCVILHDNYSDFHLTVDDVNYQYICHNEFNKEGTPKITKSVAEVNATSYSTKINYSTKTTGYSEDIKYRLAFTPSNYTAGNMTATIYDPAFTGTINGHKAITGMGQKGGEIKVDLNSIQVKDQNGKTYNRCSGNFNPLNSCYELITQTSSQYPQFGSIKIHGIQSTATILITYNATLNSSITISECRSGIACNEQFINQSFVTDMQYCSESTDSQGHLIYTCTSPENLSSPQCNEVTYYDANGVIQHYNPCNQRTITSNVTTAEGVCQYFLTRASGDVFLEDQLTYGVDISKCYPYKNVSSTVVTPTKPIPGHLASTGTPEVISINHEICSAGQSDFAGLSSLTADQKTALEQLFGANLTSLSSQICEVGLVPGSDWDATTIKSSIEQNIGKLTRWASEINPPNQISSFSELQTYAAGGVYYYDGTLPGASKTVTINVLDIPKGSGALTIVVKNADLQINGNIAYSANGDPETDPTKISSLGVVVLGGNMYVNPSVKTLSGAYFIQRSGVELSTGNVFSGNNTDPQANSTEQLTVYGSVYGNIGPLFENRTASGDVAADQGSVTIRYDQRIIQNPPQGLSDLLGNFSQSEIAQ